MLINLHIENFLIIEKTSIDFEEGLNVITGETGSGKSMIFDAIGLILGDKGAKDLIRNQAEKAFLQATFMIEDPRVHQLLEGEGFAVEDTLIISRDLYLSGKSLFKVNGRLVPSQFVRGLGQYLVNLSGQHENQILLDAVHHRQMIDEFGSDEIAPLIYKVDEQYQQYKALEAKLATYQMSESEWHKETDFLSYQIDEIKKAKLAVGEEEVLDQRYEFLKHFESVQTASTGALNLCKEDRGILSQLNRSRKLLQEVASFNPALETPLAQIDNAYYAVESAASDLRAIVDDLDYDENELSEIEVRLSIINDLKRKFGKSIEIVLEQLNSLESRYEDLLHYEANKAALERELEAVSAEYQANAILLTEARQKIAKAFELELIQQLKDLNFNQCEFFAQFTTVEGIWAGGVDRVEFYLSTNPGEPARPLRKIASGGELSRIMLSVKLVNRKGDFAPTQIFDEIDSGISGRTANAVANKLKMISKEGQVILVTHLPQIAVQGVYHLLIDKKVDGQQTKVSIEKMTFDQRINEIARMIGSGEITELTKLSAKEMLLNSTLKEVEV